MLWGVEAFATLWRVDLSSSFSYLLRSEKLQNESSPNFSIFSPGFCPEFCSEFSPNFSRIFRASFRGKRRPEKFTRNPRHLSMQNSQANTRKIFTKFFWRAGKVILVASDSKQNYCKNNSLWDFSLFYLRISAVLASILFVQRLRGNRGRGNRPEGGFSEVLERSAEVFRGFFSQVLS